MLFALDPTLAFDPFELEESVTPETVRLALAAEEWGRALIYALHLNEAEPIRLVLQSVPLAMVQTVCSEVPRLFLERLLQVLCERAQASAQVEYWLTWILGVLKSHGQYLRTNPQRYTAVLRGVQKCLLEHYGNCRDAADNNMYAVQFLTETCGKEFD